MKPYQDPEPRTHAEWCRDLGLQDEGAGCNTGSTLTYVEFCFLPQTKLYKVADAPLYDFWKQYGDVYGEPRTVREWLEATSQHLVEPFTEEDLRDLDLFLGHDEFWNWSSGKTVFNDSSNDEKALSTLLANGFRRLFTRRPSKQRG